MLSTRNGEQINEIRAIYLITGVAIPDPTIRQVKGCHATSVISGLTNMTPSYIFIGICIFLGSLKISVIRLQVPAVQTLNRSI